MTDERTRYYQVRLRRVPPEFCNDDLLESCSALAALLLYRLISQADDQGRLPGHPKHVKGVCFPMRDISERKVGATLDELVNACFVIRYSVGTRIFLQINRWFDMQGKWGQRRSYPSRYPAPPGWEQDWVNAGSDASEMRAPGARVAGDVRPPSPSALSSTPTTTAPPARLISNGGPVIEPERRRELLGRANRRQMTEQEALELGMALAGDALAEKKVR